MTRMLDIIQLVLRDLGITLVRIDGSMNGPKRQPMVDKFNEESSIDVCLVSTKAGGVGLTLTGADRVIIYGPSWTPADDIQAIHRAYRHGQTREVEAYTLVTAGTVEGKWWKRFSILTFALFSQAAFHFPNQQRKCSAGKFIRLGFA